MNLGASLRSGDSPWCGGGETRGSGRSNEIWRHSSVNARSQPFGPQLYSADHRENRVDPAILAIEPSSRSIDRMVSISMEKTIASSAKRRRPSYLGPPCLARLDLLPWPRPACHRRGLAAAAPRCCGSATWWRSSRRPSRFSWRPSRPPTPSSSLHGNVSAPPP